MNTDLASENLVTFAPCHDAETACSRDVIGHWLCKVHQTADLIEEG